MSPHDSSPEDVGPLPDSTGPSGDEVLSELQELREQAAAKQALEAFSEALGEDDPAPLDDPGLPEDYTVTEVLGHGSGGVVYRAEQHSLSRSVAVKVLMPGGSLRDTERLLGEAKRLAGLQHPAIVGIHEVGRASTGVYLTLELYGGGSLHDALADGPMNPMRAARVVRRVAEGIAYTHTNGVVHLDLKPGNVLLDESGVAAVGDFGLAREVDAMASSRSGGGLLGTPAFMAPEQAADQRELLGERTDVYGLGALLYACLSGSAPFDQQGLADTLQSVRFDDPKPLDQRTPGTPRDLAAVAAKAMAKDPSDRYPSASAVVAELARFEAGEPVQARLPGPWAMFWRACRKHHKEILVGLAGVLLGVFALLPDIERDNTSGEAWLQAAQGLLDIEQFGPAQDFLKDKPRWIALTDRQARRAQALLERATGRIIESGDQGAQGEELVLPKHALNLGLNEQQWARIVHLLGKDRTKWWQLPAGNPVTAARTWKQLITELAQLAPTASEADRAMILGLADGLPHWSWRQGFQGWVDPAPTDGDMLLERLQSGGQAFPQGAPCDVLVHAMVLDSEGGIDVRYTKRETAQPGVRLDITGGGRTSLPVPPDHFGMDVLRIGPPYIPRSDPGCLHYEVGGTLEWTDAGPYWHITDCESTLKVPGSSGSWFVKKAAGGVLAGRTEVVELHTYSWEGRWTAVMVLVHVALPGEPLPFEGESRPDLDRWRSLLFAEIQAGIDGLEERIQAGFEPSAVERAAIIDSVASLTMVGPESKKNALLGERARLQKLGEGIEAKLSKGFAPSPTYTSTTGAGADLETWFSIAATADPEVPGAALDALPRPRSAFGKSSRGLGWRGWVSMGYLMAALLLTWLWIAEPWGSAARLRVLAGVIPAAILCFDKTTLPQLGSLPLDGLASLLLILACVGLRPWGGLWASVAMGLFMGALLHEAWPFLHPGPRVALALGIVCLLLIAQRLDPKRRGGWLWAACAALFLATAVALRQRWFHPGGERAVYGFHLVLVWVMMARISLAAAARAAADETA